MFKQIRVFILIFFVFSLAYGINTTSNNMAVYIKTISFKGAVNKKELVDLKNISKQYINKKLNLKDIKKLKNRLSSYFKDRGLFFKKVILPVQDITKGSLVFYVIKTKLKNIKIEGNKYFSTKFIKRVFGFKSGEYLQYDKMLRNILVLNSYQDMSVKSYLKKGSDFGTTDVILKVEDKKPFHSTISFDNYGSQETAKNRVNIGVNYGNLLYDGDELSFKTTMGISSFNDSTRLFMFNYVTTPLGEYDIRLNAGYVYADYVVTGDLSVLDLKGDTKIYRYGISQPLYYSTVLKSDILLNYYIKDTKSFLLGDVSTKDHLNLIELKFNSQYRRLKDIITYAIGVSRGISEDNAMKSRIDSDDRFTKCNLNASYQRYINPKNSFKVSFNSQYTKERLPLSELLTSGIKGTDGTKVLGDSGINTKVEWFYYPKLDYFDWLKKYSMQIEFSLNYVKAFSNATVPGEAKSSYMTTAGSEIGLSIKKRYFGRISLSMPVNSSDSTIERKIQIYGYIGMKFW